MQIRNTADRFGLLTKVLHWLVAGLILFLVWLGWYMVGLDYFHKWYNSSLTWHKSLGIIVLILAVLKIGWQLYTPPPDVAGDLKPWEKTAATVMHRLLLLLMVLIPATGYLISTSDGKSVEVFNWFSVPALVDESKTLRDWAIDLHFYMAYSVAGLAIGHAAAALKHQFVDRDSTLTRMLWK